MDQFLNGQEFATNKWPKCTKTYNSSPKRYLIQPFFPSRWEADPLLKTWIARHPVDTGKVVCRFCQSVIRAHKNDLLEHTRTLKHQRNFMAHASPEDYNQFVMELNELRKDAQAVTKKRISGGSQHQQQQQGQSLGNGKTLNIANNVSVNITSWTNGPIGSNSNGAVALQIGDGGSGGSGNDELWSDNNDSYSAGGSPSDLVSVILEEQPEQAESPSESHNSTESISSSTTNTALAPILNLNSTSPPPHHHPPPQYQGGNGGSLATTLKPEPVALTFGRGSLSFTLSDIISAVENDCFSVNELVAIAKCSMDKVSTKLNSQCTLEQIDDNSHPLHINLDLTTTAVPKKKTLNEKRAGKRKGKRKKSPNVDNNNIKNEGVFPSLASL